MPRWDDSDRFFTPSIPLPAKGGIRAHSRRGKFASSWWGQRWIETLESFQLHSRLNRGRSYARRGQVLQLVLAQQKVVATVQGSRPRPYTVTIELKRIPDPQWRRVGRLIASNLAVAARLIAGEIPPDAERCFSEAGVALFPRKKDDLITACSCPDSSNPCKHVAAVYYLLAEQFDRDPFLLFSLRGMERKEFVAMIGTAGAAKTATSTRQSAGNGGQSAGVSARRSLAADPEVFWRGGRLPDTQHGEIAISADGAPLARRLGNLPFWRGRNNFLETISNISKSAAESGLGMLLKPPHP